VIGRYAVSIVKDVQEFRIVSRDVQRVTSYYPEADGASRFAEGYLVKVAGPDGGLVDKRVSPIVFKELRKFIVEHADAVAFDVTIKRLTSRPWVDVTVKAVQA
jgi:hypothetical protein